MILELLGFIEQTAADKRLLLTDLRVRDILLRHTGIKTHKCNPHMKTIAAILSTDIAAVSKSIKKLCELGYVERTKVKRQYEYKINFPKLDPKQLSHSTTMEENSCLTAQLRVVSRHNSELSLETSVYKERTLPINLNKEPLEKGFSNLSLEVEEEIPEQIKPLIEKLIKKLGRVRYDSLFGTCRWKLDGTKPTIVVATEFRRNQIENKSSHELYDSAREVGLNLPQFEVLNGKHTLSS